MVTSSRRFRELDFPKSYENSLCSNNLRGEVIGWFVDIGGIVDRSSLSFIISYIKESRWP